MILIFVFSSLRAVREDSAVYHKAPKQSGNAADVTRYAEISRKLTSTSANFPPVAGCEPAGATKSFTMARNRYELTHDEACRLVEDALERVGKALAYIRLRLAEDPDYTELRGKETEIRSTVDQANLLCNINYYGAYLQGARRMALALEEWDLLDFPLKKTGHGNYKSTVKRAAKAVNKAYFDLFIANTRNLEWCLHGLPDGVELFARDKVDSKGKVIGKEACFAKKQIKYQAI